MANPTFSNITDGDTIDAASVNDIFAELEALVNGTTAADWDFKDGDLNTGGKIIIDIDGTAISADGAIVLGAGSDCGFFWDGTSMVLEASTALTNTVQAIQVKHRTSGTPAAGIGIGIDFSVETADDNFEIGAAIRAVTTDVTGTSEDFDLVFYTMAAGAAAAEALRISSANVVTLAGGFADGSVGAPGITLATPGSATGFYSGGANTILAASNGVRVMSIGTAGPFGDGATGVWSLNTTGANDATAPGYTFGGDNDTGMYRVSADRVGWAAGGALKLDTSATVITAAVPVSIDDATDSASGTTGSIHTDGGLGVVKDIFCAAKVTGTLLAAGDGTVGAPGITLSTPGLDTGFYSGGANSILAASNGVRVMSIGTAGLSGDGATGTWSLNTTGAGNAAAPRYSFGGDDNTGMYRVGADSIGLTLGGTVRLTLATTVMTSTMALSVDDTTASTSGTTGSIHTDGGLGVVKNIACEGAVLVADGTVGAPSIAFKDDGSGTNNDGFYRVSNNVFAASTAGVLKFTFGANELTSNVKHIFSGEMDINGIINTDATSLPTSDPVNAGQLWNNAGVVTVS